CRRSSSASSTRRWWSGSTLGVCPQERLRGRSPWPRPRRRSTSRPPPSADLAEVVEEVHGAPRVRVLAEGAVPRAEADRAAVFGLEVERREDVRRVADDDDLLAR